MKRVLRGNIYLFWVGFIILAAMTIRVFGMSFQLLGPMVALMTGPALATLVYFIPMNDRVKAILINILLSIFFVVIGILKGGSDFIYLLCYLILGFVTIYFDPVVISIHSTVFIIFSIAIGLINKEYIGGPGTSTGKAVSLVVCYFLMAVILWLAAQRGYYAVKKEEEKQRETEQQSRKLAENAKVAEAISTELGSAIEKENENIDEISAGAANVSNAARQMSNAVEETTVSIMNVSEKVLSADKKIEQNSVLAKELKESYHEVIKQVELGKEEGSEANESMEHITETIYSANTASKELIKETGKISSILEEIDNISAQTNLLAINASIEAAHAGIHGSGFSVVADEIRRLSEQSKQASSNIQGILDRLIVVIEEVSRRVDNGVESVETGKKNISELLSVFDEIYIKAKKSEEIINHEFSLITEVKGDFNQVMKEVENVVAISEENTSMIESVTEAIVQQNETMDLISENINYIHGLSEKLEEQYIYNKNDLI